MICDRHAPEYGKSTQEAECPFCVGEELDRFKPFDEAVQRVALALGIAGTPQAFADQCVKRLRNAELCADHDRKRAETAELAVSRLEREAAALRESEKRARDGMAEKHDQLSTIRHVAHDRANEAQAIIAKSEHARRELEMKFEAIGMDLASSCLRVADLTRENAALAGDLDDARKMIAALRAEVEASRMLGSGENPTSLQRVMDRVF